MWLSPAMTEETRSLFSAGIGTGLYCLEVSGENPSLPLEV